jgi:hypothetical protein
VQVTYSENIEILERECKKILNDQRSFINMDQYLKVLEILAEVALAQATQLGANRR